VRTFTVAVALFVLPAVLAGSARSDGCVLSEFGTLTGALSGGNVLAVRLGGQTIRDAATGAPVTR
jgi:hypothetical protein